MKQPSRATFIALGRVQTLLQGLGATPAGALTRPPEETSHIRGPKSPAGVVPTHTLSVVLSAKEKETSLISKKQRLQRVTGLKPSKSTNALPPAWQFSLSWGGASADEEHRVLGRHYGQAARDCEEKPPDHMGPAGCPPRKLSSSVSSTEDLAGVKLADSTLYTISPRATLSPRGTMRRTATKPGTDAMVRRLNTPSG